MRRVIFFWLIGAVLISGSAVYGAVEEGAAKQTPWSGYWWPIFKGEMISGPLMKYDRLTGHAAAEWEAQRNPPGPGTPRWHGYCHAWSASAVLEQEPKGPHAATGTAGHGQLMLGIGDQKGMLAASHAQDVANVFGQRYQGPPGDMQDIYPDALWRCLKQYIGQQGVPLIMDMEAGPEVWNYPVYAYRIEYTPTGSGSQHMCTLSLWAADDSVPPDYIGVKVLYHTYTFTVEMRNGSVVMGSGRWVGNSVRNHPDFAWYPYVVRPQNPEVEYAMVKQLVGVDSVTPPDNTPGTNPPGTPPGTSTDNPPGSNPPGTSTDTSPGTNPPGTGTPGTGGGATPPGTTPGAEPPIIDPAGGTGTQGAIPISPLQLISLIAQKTSSFDFDVTVDRFDGGHYAVGENFLIRGASARAGYLYLFYFNSAGDLWLLYPQPGQGNYIPARQRFEVPGPGATYVFQTVEPVGTARIKALVTSRPLILSGLAMQDQSTQQKGLRRTARRAFRWWPTQEAQAREMLVKYQEQPQLMPQQLDGIDPLRLLGPFAQDEVAIYVKSAGK